MTAILAARPTNVPGRLHALRPGMEETYCRRVQEFAVVGRVEPARITCGICRRALARAMATCRDCGRPGQGKICPACRLFQKRNPGRRRRRERKPARCRFDDDELAELYRRYRNDESLNELARQVGVSNPTLKARFKEAGYRLRGPKLAARARRRRDRALAPTFPTHPHATPKPHYVSAHESSLLSALLRLLLDGRRFTIEELAEQSQYGGGATARDALYRLRHRGFVEFDGRWNRGLRLTPLALRRETRAAPQERMAAVYRRAMNSGDLARAAGVATTTALKFIKVRMKEIF